MEAVIRQFPGIKDATVQAFDDPNGGKFIAAYIVGDEQIDINALNNFILEEKPPYMVPAVTMQIEKIPLNQNQKVNKRDNSEQPSANVPMNLLEEELHEMVADIIGNTDFGITTVLGYAGLTSISAIKLAIQVNKHYGITLDAKSLVKNGTLQSIENEILKGVMNIEHSAAQKEADANNVQSSMFNVPLSYAQTGVYFDCLKNPTSTLYNIPYCIKFQRNTDTTALIEAVRTLVKAHPQMAVHFGNGQEGISQAVDLEQVVEIPVKQMGDEELAQYKQDFVKPFDLSTGPSRPIC